METKFRIAAAVIVGAGMLLPSLAVAKVEVSAQGNITANAPTPNFCTNLPTLSSQINAKITSGETNLAARQQEALQAAQDRMTKRAQALAVTRTQGDQERVAIYAQLSAKATTTAQSQAVAQFQAAIEAGVTARRAAVDAAIRAYWSGVSAALSARQAAIKTAEQNFTVSLQAALTTATTECSSGVAAATARAHFAASLKSAQVKFISDRKAVDKTGPQIKALVQTRNAAVEAAMSAFKATAVKARADLKVAFPTL